MAKVARIGFLCALIVCLLSGGSAFAQFQRDAQDPEVFRARLQQYMEELQALQPSRVDPEVIDSISRLSSKDLEVLQNAFPKDEWFWNGPRTLRQFVIENGIDSVISTEPDAFTKRYNLPRAGSDADTTKPIVTTFILNTPQIKEGETMTFGYAVNDTGGSGLKHIELWRAMDEDGVVNVDTWVYVGKVNLSGNSASSTFTYKPASFGTYWFGCHVLDNDGNTTFEPAPVKGVVKFDPDKQCPIGFNYEALWLARDAETVCEIAKEMIPEDAFTSVPYLIAATAWSISKGLKFSVEQIYSRWQDCENNNVSAKIDTPVSSRASQSSLDSLRTKVDAFDLSRLDDRVTSRASQSSVNDVNSKLSSLDTSNIDAKVSSRASQTSVDDVKGLVDGLETNVDAKMSSRASQTSMDEVKNFVDGLETNVDAKMSSRASQTSLDEVKGFVDGLETNVDAKMSSRASQSSVDSANTKLNTLDTTRLDTPVSSRASEASLGARASVIDGALNGAHGKLDTIGGKVDVVLSTRATQASIDDITNTLNIQEPLSLSVVTLEKDRRYLVQITKRGAPVAGATVQELRLMTTDKNGQSLSTLLTPATREVSPGILEITFALAPGTRPGAFAITVNHAQGATTLYGSAIWPGSASDTTK